MKAIIEIAILIIFLMAQTGTAVSDYDQYKSIHELKDKSPYWRNYWYLQKNYDSWEHIKTLHDLIKRR